MNQNKKRKLYIVLSWIPTILCMILIFKFSGQNSDKSTNTSNSVTYLLARIFVPGFSEMDISQKLELAENLRFFIRKTAHFTIYFILGLCVRFGLNISLKNSIRKGMAEKSVITLIICMAYATSDEIHQLFISGRSGKFADVLIDTSGALLSLIIVNLILYFISKSKNSKKALDK